MLKTFEEKKQEQLDAKAKIDLAVKEAFDKNSKLFEFFQSKLAETETPDFTVVISSEKIDRYGDVIKLDGWELENFMANPVVLWGHNGRQFPIGKALRIYKQDGKLLADGKFAPEGIYEEADVARKLYATGYLNATSVGFIGKEGGYVKNYTDSEGKVYAEVFVYTKAELLEFSFVTIPANPEALRKAFGDTWTPTKENILKELGLFLTKENEEEKTDKTDEEVKADEEITTKQLFDTLTEVKTLLLEVKELVYNGKNATTEEDKNSEGNSTPESKLLDLFRDEKFVSGLKGTAKSSNRLLEVLNGMK